ncbi:MAG: spermidine synthase [Magnetococcales bacterium]|nr:spermidine synthase [Magnetococcales bacterium]
MKKHNLLWIYPLFFFSGIPALLYQIVWQRSLFTLFGTNIESVTVVVAAFMAGLGLGSLGGGYLSDRIQHRLLAAFALIELSIGTFGLISLALFQWVGGTHAGSPLWELGIISFLLVLLPTMLMGATLPILTAYLVRLSGSVGKSVGILYFVNTLGSAFACFAAARYLMGHLGQQGTVYVAVALNLMVGGGALVAHLLTKASPKPQQSLTESHDPSPDLSPISLKIPMAMLFAGMAGFISLSFEIVWIRVYAYLTRGEAGSLAYVLGFFLIGVAFGSLIGHKISADMARKGKMKTLRLIFILLVCANGVGFLLIPLIGQMIQFLDPYALMDRQSTGGQIYKMFYYYNLSLPLITLGSALWGAMLPFLSHISVKADSKAGSGLSYIYVSNIIGSVSGSLITGFILMDIFKIQQISLILGLLGLLMAWLMFVVLRDRHRQPLWRAALTISLAAVVMVVWTPVLYAQIYEKLTYKKGLKKADIPLQTFKMVIENRSGVITVSNKGVVYGGGAYDGTVNTYLDRKRMKQKEPGSGATVYNNVVSSYVPAAFHPAIKKVLLVGMSSGAHAQVLANLPELEKMTIIEINPGYLEVTRQFPEIASLMDNPKVEIIINDGRRWLQANPEEKFDLIYMNNTHHWRSFNSNLLSVEFFHIVRSSLKEEGLFMFNTTNSLEAKRSATLVFPAVTQYNLLIAKNSPIQADPERLRAVLTNYTIDGQPVLQQDSPASKRIIQGILHRLSRLKSTEEIQKLTAQSRPITDDNMGHEWRRY